MTRSLPAEFNTPGTMLAPDRPPETDVNRIEWLAPAKTRAYLSSRDLASPEKAAARTREIVRDWQELQIKTALGVKFRHHARVAIVRPRWMPGFLFRRLLRSIVVETQNEERAR